MTNLTKTDLRFTADGDIALEPADKYRTADIHGYDSLIQTVKIRLGSSDPDVIDPYDQDFCCNLEDLIGLPNTIQTAEQGIAQIKKSLTYDGLVSADDLLIRPTVSDRSTISFYVFIRITEQSFYSIEIMINLENGVTIGREKYDTL